MNWLDQTYECEDMSLPTQSVVPSENFYVTDYENHPVFYQQQYSFHAVQPSGSSFSMMYPSSNYAEEETNDRFVHHNSDSFISPNVHDSNSAGFNLPGMPLQAMHFENSHYSSVPRENSSDIVHGSSVSTDEQLNALDKREENYHRKGRNSRFHGRGRGRDGYFNAHVYYNHGQRPDYSDRDVYFGAPQYYAAYSPHNRGRGRYVDGPRGKGMHHQNFHNFSEQGVGNGDGKPPKRKDYKHKSEHNRELPNEHKDEVLAKIFNKDESHNDGEIQHNMPTTESLSSHFEQHNEHADTTTTESRKYIKSSVHENQGNFKGSTRTDQRADHSGYRKSAKSSKYESSGKKQREKDVKDLQEKESMRWSDEISHNKSKGQGYSANRGRGASGRQFTDKYKSGSQSLNFAENDESQRGSLTEQLSAGKYECMVCCDNVHVEVAIWSCQKCYHVFHLSCIQKWAHSSIDKETRSWRCPGCQNVSAHIPSQHRCFCGRRRDPKYIRGEIPHSCGEACRKKRTDGCKHPCPILCHPGPCPPCSSTIWISCDCGKERKNVRCSVAVNFKCNDVCNKLLNCQEHKCQEQCHNEPCPPCMVSKTQECFCKKTTRKVMCGTGEFKMLSFSCEKPCGRILICGNHACEEECHPGECAPCALMPGNLKTCCCGKTPLSKIEAEKRQSCLDAVPTCHQVCNKPLICGSVLKPHLCERKCHDGECGPCNRQMQLKCECGATEKKMPCEVAIIYNELNPFKCQRRCGKKKTCGKHKCSDNCCVKDIHICEIVCGQKLACGIHKCEELCHRGNCKRCLQASFEELTCYCGAEVLEPPVPCGTRPPECHMTCTRQHDCDHPVRHNCHRDSTCPPCTELTNKMCVGGHMMRNNVPCHMTNISCGYPCNKILSCGLHKCSKTCHKGNCLEEGAVCTQMCLRTRPACGHPCGASCHSGECPDTPCKTEITITCPCGNRTAKAQCLQGGDQSNDIVQFQRLSVQSVAESGGQGIDLSQFAQTKKSNKRLDCDTNCGIIERNRRMALALEIKNPDMSAKLGTPTFTEFLKDFAKKNPKFAMNVEKNLSDLVQSAKQSAQPNRSHPFQSMNRDQRRFVHELAEFYGCQTQSYDFEPQKNVVATASKDKCWMPNLTLTQHVLKDQLPKAPPPISTFRNQGVTFTVLEKKKLSTKETSLSTSNSSRAWETAGATATSSTSKPEPSIDYFDFTC